MMILVLTLSITGLFLVRDWFVHEFHIHGAEMIVPTPDFALDVHKLTAIGLLILGAIHLVAHAGQKEKPILPKKSFIELKAALYSLMFLVFLAKKQERGSGGKYLKSQKIIYAFTVYVLGLAAITGFLYLGGILVEYLLIAHIVAGVLVLLVVVHRLALVIRRHDKVALRSVLATGTMPKWYVKKNHRVWYEEIVGKTAQEVKESTKTKPEIEVPVKTKEVEKPKEKEEQIAADEKPVPSSPHPSKSG